MFTTIMFFSCVVAAFEISIVWNIKPLYRIITETKYGSLAGVIMSIMLSSLVAGFFGATGMIVMGGAVFGTIITAIIYYLRLIELVFGIVQVLRTFIEATKQFIINTRDTIQRTVVRARRFFYGVRHPVATIRYGNPVHLP